MSNWRLGWRFIKGIDILPHYAGGESGVRAAAQKGAILFHKREWPPLDPPRERKGPCPLTPPLSALGLKSCTRCAIGRGVHGFAMNPYVSTHPATAPYYREARVTLPRRQTACEIAALLRSPH